jgi:hypothetical protein
MFEKRKDTDAGYMKLFKKSNRNNEHKSHYLNDLSSKEEPF